MRSYIRKPKGVLVKQMAERLLQINGYILLFPDAYNTKLQEDEIIDIMMMTTGVTARSGRTISTS